MEVWKSVPDYEGLYAVSSFGRVKSLKTGKLRSLGEWTKGQHLSLNLYRYGQPSPLIAVHRLVAQVFLPMPSSRERLVVNHKNGNKQDNRVENLEWCTPTENALHAYDIGTRKVRVILATHAEKLTMRERRAMKELHFRGLSHSTIADIFIATEEVVKRVIRK